MTNKNSGTASGTANTASGTKEIGSIIIESDFLKKEPSQEQREKEEQRIKEMKEKEKQDIKDGKIKEFTLKF